MTRYVQNHALSEAEHPGGTDPKFYDIIDEFFVTAPQALDSIARDTAVLSAVRELENELLDTSRTRAFVAATIHNIP